MRRSGAHAGIVVDVPGRHELTDAEWALLAPFMPAEAPKGKKWADHRKIINAILLARPHRRPLAGSTRALRPLGDRSRTPPPLVPGRHLAKDRRPAACRCHHRRGTHREHRLHHGPSPPARRRGDEKGGTAREEPDGREALGRSRGGPTTKIHLIADQYRRPLVLATTPGRRGDSPLFEPLMGALRLPRSTGRPRTRPDRWLGDKAYSSRTNRDHLRKRKIKAAIAQPRDQRTPPAQGAGG